MSYDYDRAAPAGETTHPGPRFAELGALAGLPAGPDPFAPPGAAGRHGRAPEAEAAGGRAALEALAANLRWAWDAETRRLFADLGGERFAALRSSPVALLREVDEIPRAVLDRAASLARDLRAHLEDERTWADLEAPSLAPRPVAYLSMEFGLHESLACYSGGLGVLAGDHLKSASDLGVPLVGVGLFYAEGYFQQELDRAGEQIERYQLADRGALPIRPACGPRGETPVELCVDTLDGPIHARVLEARVGRVRLVLLDADVPQNGPEERALTARLYGGDERTRLRQELLLGVGGLRALRALGIHPSVLHLNEGHCALATLELARQHVQDEGVAFAEAARRVARQTVFTTHTPVAAGHDRFDGSLVERQLAPLRESLGLDPDAFLALGRVRERDEEERFCMTTLALRLSRSANGVSHLHGHVSRHMWHGLWPDRAEHEVPIGHVTNGVHLPTWMAPQMQALLSRHAGSDWLGRQTSPFTFRALDAASDEELWATHQELKRGLVAYVRDKAVTDARSRGEGEDVVRALGEALSEDVLLVGFARRFAAYKRATLLVQDLELLDRLVNDPVRPLTLVFAGKAHPRDAEGKALLRRVHETTRDPRFLGRVVLLEGYDMEVGRHLVQGVDLWLNNPRRPFEASGTSGQKVALNGGLNCSVLDGWWAEAWDGRNGFAIGRGLAHRRPEEQDLRDYEDLRRVLVDEVLPTYYGREGGVPRAWISRVRRSMETLGPRFCSDRMVRDYVRRCYLPAAGLTLAGMPGGRAPGGSA